MKTRWIRSRRWVPKGSAAITLFGHVFHNCDLTPRLRRHETIHVRQQREMLYVPFFVWYGLEWLVRLLQYGNGHKAYLNISFEREAYSNDADAGYLDRRRRWAFLRYLLMP